MRQTDKGPIGFRSCAFIVLAVYLTIGSTIGFCQSTDPHAAPPPLPPAAQEAINKGIIAAKVPDYLLAIRYFEEARKIAPAAPLMYLNLGLAESRIPGRELRAMAWFGAYLAAYPDAPNAATVKEQIAVLDVKVQSNTLGFLKFLDDAARQISGKKRSENLAWVARRWARAGESSAALKTVDLVHDADDKGRALAIIAEAQAGSGDISGARKSADRIPESLSKSEARRWLATAQAGRGDIEGAQKTADVIQDPMEKSMAQLNIARAQIQTSDIAGALKTLVTAQKTADLIQRADYKGIADEYIAEERAGITTTPASSRAATSVAPRPIGPAVTIADWLHRLDDDVEANSCALNTALFLDWAGYLNALPAQGFGTPAYVLHSDGRYKETPPSENAQSVVEGLGFTADRIITAQIVVKQMLKKQARR